MSYSVEVWRLWTSLRPCDHRSEEEDVGCTPRIVASPLATPSKAQMRTSDQASPPSLPSLKED